MVKAAVRENASTAQSQEAYLKKYEALTERYEAAAQELERLQTERTFRTQQDKSIALFMRTFKKLPDTMTGWDDTIWTVMVEKGIVHKDGGVKWGGNQGRSVRLDGSKTVRRNRATESQNQMKWVRQMNACKALIGSHHEV